MLHEVLIPDPEDLDAITEWATAHCKSFVKVDEIDVSNFSYTSDVIAGFYFQDDKDALLFRLKYK